jgi:hypothetical protein
MEPPTGSPTQSTEWTVWAPPPAVPCRVQIIRLEDQQTVVNPLAQPAPIPASQFARGTPVRSASGPPWPDKRMDKRARSAQS